MFQGRHPSGSHGPEIRIVPQEVSWDGETLSIGGLARIAAAAKEVRGAVEGSLLLSSGKAYTSDRGDGKYPFLNKRREKKPTTMVTTDVLPDFIIRHTPIAPEIDGRITQTGTQ